MRALAQAGERFGFYSTTLMARALPPEAAKPGHLAKEAFNKQKARTAAVSRGVSAAQVAQEAGYEEVTVNFTQTPEGRAMLLYSKEEERKIDVPYSKLQAFTKGIDGGTDGGKSIGSSKASWGVRTNTHIRNGAVVVELCGQWLNDLQCDDRAPPRPCLEGIDCVTAAGAA